MNHKEFLKERYGFVLAPAGHGKTHAISECLHHTEGKFLILTHTHAGIASIREKIVKVNPALKNFHIETITGYAQKYVLAYYSGKDIPDRDKGEEYYPFIVRKATVIFQKPFVKKILATSYQGLFVDEYQDCSMIQHQLILALSLVLPTYVFGDHLQGIFNFNSEEMVNLEDALHMQTFNANQQRLAIPWRWKDKNEQLGNTLIDIRKCIELKQEIDLTKFVNIEYIKIENENDLYNPSKDYYRQLARKLTLQGVLIIHPDSTSIHPRKKIISSFRIPIGLVESIDDKDFYKFARLLDTATAENIGEIISTVSFQLFSKTEISNWFNDYGLKNKKKPEEKVIKDRIENELNLFGATGSFKSISTALKLNLDIPGIRCYRKELFYSLCDSLDNAHKNAKTVYESIVEQRNLIRRIGRKSYGRSIGTTLLTKGLEYDHVIILDAHKFKCPKNLYVALTRASKKLIVFSKTSTLLPDY